MRDPPTAVARAEPASCWTRCSRPSSAATVPAHAWPSRSSVSRTATPSALGEEATEVLRDLAGRPGRPAACATRRHDWYWAEDQPGLRQRAPAPGSDRGRARASATTTCSTRAFAPWIGTRSEVRASTRPVHTPRRPSHRARRHTAHPGTGDEQPLERRGAGRSPRPRPSSPPARTRRGRRAVRAFEWFLGRNRLDTAVYDFATGGCHDGLGERAVNVNEGAESTLAYLQALLAARRGRGSRRRCHE